MSTSRWSTFFGIAYVGFGTASLFTGVLLAVTVTLPRHGLDAPDAASTSCFGLGLLAAGYGVRWASTHRWPRVLAVLALAASAAVALTQVVSHWGQPLNAMNVSTLFLRLLFLVFVWILPRLLADNHQKR